MNKEYHHPLYSTEYEKYLQSAREMPLKILILGPARGSPGYEKREEIRNHLRHSSCYYDVAFEEDFAPVEPGMSENDPYGSIAFRVAISDIIFALTIDHHLVSGVLSEITYFRNNKSFIERTYVILPKHRGPKRKSSKTPLIWASVRIFPERQRCEYTLDEFSHCCMIRDWVAAKADECRLRNRYMEFLRERGIEPPTPF